MLPASQHTVTILHIQSPHRPRSGAGSAPPAFFAGSEPSGARRLRSSPKGEAGHAESNLLSPDGREPCAELRASLRSVTRTRLNPIDTPAPCTNLPTFVAKQGRGSQVVRQKFAKLPFAGSIPAPASSPLIEGEAISCRICAHQPEVGHGPHVRRCSVVARHFDVANRSAPESSNGLCAPCFRPHNLVHRLPLC